MNHLGIKVTAKATDDGQVSLSFSGKNGEQAGLMMTVEEARELRDALDEQSYQAFYNEHGYWDQSENDE
jgi:hypothetical protein